MVKWTDLIIPALLTGAFTLTLFMQGYQDTHYAPALALLMAGMGGGLWLSLRAGTLSLPTSFAALCVVLLWALSALAFSVSTIPFTSQIAFLIFSAFPVAFLATHIAAARQDIVKPLCLMAMAVISGLALCAVAKAIFIHDGSFGSRAHWPFLSPNSLASILMVGLIPATGLALGTNDERHRKILTVLTLLLYAGLLATGSRAAILAAIIALGVLLLSNRGSFAWKSLAPAGVAALGISLFLPLLSGRGFWSGFAALGQAENVSVTDRLSLWKAAWKMMLDHPWTGTGPGTFSAHYPPYREMMADQSTGKFAHMDSLQMGTEMGVFAPVLFYALLIGILIRTLSAIGVTTNDPALRLRVTIPFAALLAVALHAHVDFPLFLMPILIACGVLLALWHLATAQALGEGQNDLDLTPSPRRWAVWGGGAVLAALLLVLAVPTALGSHTLHKALRQTNPESYLTGLAKADRVGPDSFIDPEIELARINIRLLSDSAVESPNLRQSYINDSEALLNSAESWNPVWAEIDFLRGQLRMQQDRAADGVNEWKKALQKNPMHFETRRALAEYLLRTGQNASAITVVSDGLKYPHPMAYRAWSAAFLKGEIK